MAKTGVHDVFKPEVFHYLSGYLRRGRRRRPLLSLGFVYAGVMRAIPEEDRDKMPLLINHANNDYPFIAPFNWGEQGLFPGIGNKHGNLLTSFLVIGEKEPGK